MEKTYNWVTPKCAKVELTVYTEHIATKTHFADGDNVEVGCDEYSYHYSLKLNGATIAADQLLYVYNYNGVNAINCGKQGKNTLLIAVPDDVYNSIYGEEMEKRKAREERIDKAESEYEKHCDMMNKAMKGY